MERRIRRQHAQAIYAVECNRRDRAKQRKLTADAATSSLHIHLHDQAPRLGGTSASFMSEAPSGGTFGALEADTDGIGGEIVGRFRGSAASYALMDDGDGNCIVIRVGESDDALDPGGITTGENILPRGSGARMTGDAKRRWQANRSKALRMLAQAAGGKAA